MSNETLQPQLASLIRTDEDAAHFSQELLREIRKRWLEEALLPGNGFEGMGAIPHAICRDYLKAEEALSDAVLAILVQINDGRCHATNRRAFFAWVRAIVRKRAYSKLRRNARERWGIVGMPEKATAGATATAIQSCQHDPGLKRLKRDPNNPADIADDGGITIDDLPSDLWVCLSDAEQDFLMYYAALPSPKPAKAKQKAYRIKKRLKKRYQQAA